METDSKAYRPAIMTGDQVFWREDLSSHVQVEMEMMSKELRRNKLISGWVNKNGDWLPELVK